MRCIYTWPANVGGVQTCASFAAAPAAARAHAAAVEDAAGNGKPNFVFRALPPAFLTAADYPSGFVVLGYVAHCHQQRNHRSRILRARKQVRRRSAHTIESAFRIDGSAGRSGTVQWVTRACIVNALDKGNEKAKGTAYRTTDEWTPALIYLHFALEQA